MPCPKPGIRTMPNYIVWLFRKWEMKGAQAPDGKDIPPEVKSIKFFNFLGIIGVST
jgi:hypothetical protein